jgi:hypothetical protein
VLRQRHEREEVGTVAIGAENEEYLICAEYDDGEEEGRVGPYVLSERLGDAEDEAGGDVLNGGEKVKDSVVAARRVIFQESRGSNAFDVGGS